MRMRLSLVLGLAACIVGSAGARTLPDCPRLSALIEDLSGYRVTAPPAAPENGWCVLDGARLVAAGRPDLTASHLRLRDGSDAAMPGTLDIKLAGLKLALRPGDRQTPDWARSALRLQTADLTLSLIENPAADRLEIRSFMLTLSGGTRIEIDADIAGAGMSAASILTGTLTELRLRWRSDGRTLRPMMEAAGLAIREASDPAAPVDVARAALRRIVGNLPSANMAGGSLKAAMALVHAVPQGRGRLDLSLTSARIGAAQLGLLALAEDPDGPEALARLLAGAVLAIDWQPGLGDRAGPAAGTNHVELVP